MDQVPRRTLQDVRLCIVGLGYVGLPLAVEFGSTSRPWASTSQGRASPNCAQGRDSTREVSAEELAATPQLALQRRCGRPCATATSTSSRCRRRSTSTSARTSARWIGASRTIGRALKRGDVVIYESTVYPGATEEVCVPILERESGPGLQPRTFFAGYSPERINPGDKEHRVTTIRQGHLRLDAGGRRLRRRAVPHASSPPAPTRRSSIRVAEAAKVIENTQRDVNIALINELALIFNRLGIDTAGGAARPPAPSGTSCRSAPAWSAATASASIPTT